MVTISKLEASPGLAILPGWTYLKVRWPGEAVLSPPPGHPPWLGGCLLWTGKHFGSWAAMIQRWMFGGEKTWRCHSVSGSVAVFLRRSLVAGLGTSSGHSTPTPSRGTRTLMGSTPPGLWKCGWRSTRGSSTCTGQTF